MAKKSQKRGTTFSVSAYSDYKVGITAFGRFRFRIDCDRAAKLASDLGEQAAQKDIVFLDERHVRLYLTPDESRELTAKIRETLRGWYGITSSDQVPVRKGNGDKQRQLRLVS